MFLPIFSFLAGVLTVLAPCVLPLLPIIIGSSSSSRQKWKPYVVILSLLVSITLFTLILKASTVLIDVPPLFWSSVSAIILIFLGLTYLFPDFWAKISSGFSKKSDDLLAEASEKENLGGAILSGFALGPVFTSCSPTYSLIVASILPISFAWGLVNLLAYNLGLALVLLLISIFGQKAIKKFKWATDPQGGLKKFLGLLFIFVGVAIFFSWHKLLETWIIDQFGGTFTTWENNFLEDFLN